MAVALEHKLDPSFVVIDHNNEETVREVLERGFWAAFSIYPFTKMGNERMVEIVRAYGAERIFCDTRLRLGVSDPLAVPKTAELMRRARHCRRRNREGYLPQSPCGLWQERPDQGRRLAQSAPDRSAHLVHGQFRAARRPNPQGWRRGKGG